MGEWKFGQGKWKNQLVEQRASTVMGNGQNIEVRKKFEEQLKAFGRGKVGWEALFYVCLEELQLFVGEDRDDNG